MNQILPKARVSGISGIFIQARNPENLAEWYAHHFGFMFHHWKERNSYGTEFVYRDLVPSNPIEREGTVFVIEPIKHDECAPASVRIQHRVNDLHRFCEQLETEGISVRNIEEQAYGIFATLSDPEGNEIELYQPK